MNNENNKMQVDIDNLFKQNVNDLSAIKELYRKLKEVEEKITQIKYIDSTLANKLKKEYEKLKRIILDENISAKLSADIDTINSQLDTINSQLDANNSQLNTINSQLDTIAHIFNVEFPRYSEETTDNNRLKRAIATLKDGDKLLLDGEYNFTPEKISINKKITIIGKKMPYYNGNTLESGTILNNVGFLLEDSNITVANLGLNSPNIDNGFQANTIGVFNINIKNCVVIAQAHCYLFESYNGNVFNVNVKDCESYNAIHGFISKASNVNFINCKANNHRSYGFGNIADNIQDGSANNRNNRVLNCTSYTCGFGFICYSRDTKSTNNQNNIYLRDLIWSNCFAYDCGINYFIGDTENTPTEQTYNYVQNVILDNCQEIGGSSSKSIAIGRCNNSYINNFTFSTPVLYKYNLKPNVIITGNGNKTIINDYPLSIQDIELTSSSLEFLSTSYEQTIRLTSSKFQELHSITTNNTNLRKLTLICNDGNVCIVNDENKLILTKKYFNKGSFVVLERKEDGKWYEVYGYTSFTE